jgi:hypothetical protein
MHKFRLFLSSLSFLGFFLSGQVHATQIYHFDMSVLSFLEKAKDSAIVSIEEGNIYLNSEKIMIEKN